MSYLRWFALVNQLSFLMIMHLAQLFAHKDLSKCHFYFLSLNLDEQDRRGRSLLYKSGSWSSLKWHYGPQNMLSLALFFWFPQCCSNRSAAKSSSLFITPQCGAFGSSNSHFNWSSHAWKFCIGHLEPTRHNSACIFPSGSFYQKGPEIWCLRIVLTFT